MYSLASLTILELEEKWGILVLETIPGTTQREAKLEGDRKASEMSESPGRFF
jgi:hypothetical protein